MLMYNNSMGNDMDDMVEQRPGFTIIEVMLFLAISGFLLVGILVGTGSSIANQRYKDAVQDAVDAIRNAYSFVADTQIELRTGGGTQGDKGVCGALTADQITESVNPNRQTFNSGRGRTNCVVYGAVVAINKDTIQTTTLIGEDYVDSVRQGIIEENSTDSDIQLLKRLNANNVAIMCSDNTSDVASGCSLQTAGKAATQKLKWDITLKNPPTANGEVTDFQKTLLIFRSPRSGSIQTYVYNDLITYGPENATDYNDYIGTDGDAGSISGNIESLKSAIKDAGVNDLLTDDNFKNVDLRICVNSNGAASYSNHSRMVRILKNAHSQTGIELIDMDSDKEEDQCD